MIVFTVNEQENICIAGLNRRAGYATVYPDDQTNLSQTCVLSEFIFNNSKIIDRSDHWSLLLFKEALAIRRFKPELNHGTKASKDLKYI